MLGRSLILAILTVCISPVATAREAVIGRCHMDECSWFVVLSKDIVGSSDNGALFRITAAGGSSIHPNGAYNRKAPIKWNDTPNTTYVFCSKSLPALMYDVGTGEFTSVFFHIGPDSFPPGVLESAFSIYLYVCHGVSSLNKSPVDSLIKKFNYSVSLQDIEAAEKAVRTPQDLLKLKRM